MKPFNLEEALTGKAVKLRDGSKAYVRHHETELPVDEDMRLMGFLPDGSMVSWRVDGYYDSPKYPTDGDIIGMYPETRVINGFEVPAPAPETEVPVSHANYYIATPTNECLYSYETWSGCHNHRMYLLERGLVFLNKEDAIATAKAMLGIDPYEGDES